MKKITYNNVLLVLLMLTIIDISKAQYVTIPDAALKSYLQTNYSSCMNSGQLDTTCSSVLNATTIDLTNLGITNLTGIQYFKNLTSISFGANSISILPVLPNSLTSIECDNCQLTSFTKLPSSLQTFQCANNLLTSLPTLPAMLNYLRCDLNHLTTLPALPSSLTYLYCTQNKLTCLPLLPNGLTSLYATQNNVTCIPNVPPGLNSSNTDSTFNVCNGSNNPHNCNIATSTLSSLSSSELSLFPNPSTGTVTITYPSHIFTEVKIINAQACIVYGTIGQFSDLTVNLNNLTKGMYLVQIISGDAIITRKLLLE